MSASEVASKGTEFTCFTWTRVQILTQKNCFEKNKGLAAAKLKSAYIRAAKQWHPDGKGDTVLTLLALMVQKYKY